MQNHGQLGLTATGLLGRLIYLSLIRPGSIVLLQIASKVYYRSNLVFPLVLPQLDLCIVSEVQAAVGALGVPATVVTALHVS